MHGVTAVTIGKSGQITIMYSSSETLARLVGQYKQLPPAASLVSNNKMHTGLSRRSKDMLVC